MDADRKSVSTLAFTWRIERRDGAGIALTSHDRELIRGGVSYRSDPGIVPAAITRTLGLEPNSGEVAGVLASAVLTEMDLTLGRWDGARASLEATDWGDADAPALSLIAGEVGEVALEGETFSAELRGAASQLDEAVCPSTSPQCRAEFGDKSCRVDLAGRTVRARVIECDGVRLKLDHAMDERFLFGRIRMLSGDNCGVESVILTVDADEVRVRYLARVQVAVGTTVELREGCDKRFRTCVNRFGNAVNFRGEPHLPGNDLLTRYPGA